MVNRVNKVNRVNGFLLVFCAKQMYLVGSTSIGQKSGPPVNRVFRWSISRITTFWAQIWNRSDPFYILTIFVGSFF